MENIKIENTSQYQSLKGYVDYWTNELGKYENLLEAHPDYYPYKVLTFQAKTCMKESIENLNEYLFKYGK